MIQLNNREGNSLSLTHWSAIASMKDLEALLGDPRTALIQFAYKSEFEIETRDICLTSWSQSSVNICVQSDSFKQYRLEQVRFH